MQHTEHYQLGLWEPSDQVVHEAFNENTEKIDAALAGLAESVTATAAQVAASMPRVAVGTYTGNNKYGSSNPVKLTFDFKPKFIMVWGYSTYIMLAVEGQKAKIHYDDGKLIMTGTTWGNNYVSWYYEASGGFAQMNDSNYVYSYIAIG